MQRGLAGSEAAGFRHEAVFYSGLDDLVAKTVPFVTEGLERREPVLVALLPDRIRRLRSALSRDADHVAFLDLGWVGRNPARIIPVWRRFVRDRPSGRQVRGVGEPVWSGRSEAEIEECRLHESLLNLAFDDGPAWRLACPYDVEALPTWVVQDAMRTHPMVTPEAGRTEKYAGHPLAAETFTSPLPPAPRRARELLLDDLDELQGALRAWAHGAGLSHRRSADLATAVHELAAEAGRGNSEGMLRAWSEPGWFLVEVTGIGPLADPLSGRDVVPDEVGTGRGLWIANQLCDLVQARSVDTAAVVRIHSRL